MIDRPRTGTRRRPPVLVLGLAAILACKSDATGPPESPAQCQVTAVSVSPAQATVEVGHTVTLTATITQQNCSSLQVAWSSSNMAVGQVSDGVVTGVAPGTATITATVNTVSGEATVDVTPRALVVSWEYFRYVAIGQGVPPFDGEVDGLTGISASDLYAASGGRVHRFDGASWSLIRDGGNPVNGLWAAGPGDLFAASGNTMARWTGGSWSSHPAGAPMNAVWGTGASDVFAVGDGGTVLHYDGNAWAPLTSGTSVDLYAVFGFAANDVFAAGDGGVILHYDGSQWTVMASGVSTGLRAVWGSGPANVFAAGTNAVLRYDGNAWASIPLPPLPSTTFFAIWGTGASEVYFGGSNATSLRYDGVSLQPAAAETTRNLRSMWGTRTELFAGGSNATFRLVNGEWKKLSFVPDLRGVHAFGPSNAVAVGDEGTIIRFNGSAWTPENSGTNARLYGIAAAGPAEIWAAGTRPPNAYAFMLRFDGTSWSEVTLPTTAFASLFAVSVTGPGQVFAVGSGGNALRLSGGTWIYENVGQSESLRGIWGATSNDVYAVGDGGRITRFDGSGWMDQGSGTTNRLRAVWGTGSQDLWAVGDNGTVMRNDGTGWSSFWQLGTLPLTGVWGPDPTDVFATGFNGAVHRFNGTDWDPARLDDVDRKLNAIHGAGGAVFAVGPGGSIWVGR